MLTKEELDTYEERLNEERSKLLDGVKKNSRPEDFGGETMDPEDEEADEAEEFANELATGEVRRERINDIDAALQRIKDGKYGICEKCGGEIPKEVLNLVPESRYCEDCK